MIKISILVNTWRQKMQLNEIKSLNDKDFISLIHKTLELKSLTMADLSNILEIPKSTMHYQLNKTTISNDIKDRLSKFILYNYNGVNLKKEIHKFIFTSIRQDNFTLSQLTGIIGVSMSALCSVLYGTLNIWNDDTRTILRYYLDNN